MPIYEFYCSRCHTIYNFFSRTANTGKIPLCPRCPDIPLQRQMSVFATVSGAKESDAVNPFPALDEKKMEKELVKLAATAEKMGDNDPRAAAELMRKFSAMTGMKMGAGFTEALKRMENGEDPEKIEAEMGELLAAEDSFTMQQSGKKPARGKARIDETLYDL